MEKKIGIIGGMGAAASCLFYQYVTEMTEVSCDQDHLNLMILSDASMPDRTQAILAGEYDEVERKLLDDALTLQKCGCDAIGVTCNTAHFFVDRIVDRLDIPVIHMIDRTASEIAGRDRKGQTAVLATDGTVRTGLYQKRLEKYDEVPFLLPEEYQKLVMYEIYDRIKKGLPCDREVWGKLECFIRRAGCVNAVLACTELSVIKNEIGLDDFYVDPMRVLAREVILFAGKKLKKEYMGGAKDGTA